MREEILGKQKENRKGKPYWFTECTHELIKQINQLYNTNSSNKTMYRKRIKS